MKSDERALAESIGGFAALVGELLSVLDESRLKVLCLLEMRGVASFSEIERVMDKRGGAVAHALRTMIDAGLVSKTHVSLSASKMHVSRSAYHLTAYGHIAFAFCRSLANVIRNSEDPPAYMNVKGFQQAKKFAEVFVQAERLKPKEARIVRVEGEPRKR